MTCQIDTQFTLEDWNLFGSAPVWRAVTVGGVPERMRKMRDPALRQAIRDDYDRRLREREANP